MLKLNAIEVRLQLRQVVGAKSAHYEGGVLKLQVALFVDKRLDVCRVNGCQQTKVI